MNFELSVKKTIHAKKEGSKRKGKQLVRLHKGWKKRVRGVFRS